MHAIQSFQSEGPTRSTLLCKRREIVVAGGDHHGLAARVGHVSSAAAPKCEERVDAQLD